MYFKSKLHTGLINPNGNQAITVLPTASTGKFRIRNYSSEPYTYNVFSVTGAEIRATGLAPEIDITNVASGVYFVKIHHANNVYIKRIIKL